MSEVFADSFYYIALLNTRDLFHERAKAVSRRGRARVVTTQWVLIELADALCAPAIRERTHRWINCVFSDPNSIVIRDDAPWFELGLALYGQRPDKSWSLTDCISFAVMESRGIREALTGDHHFGQAGFVPLLALSP